MFGTKHKVKVLSRVGRLSHKYLLHIPGFLVLYLTLVEETITLVRRS
jgi:hypothetical protein